MNWLTLSKSDLCKLRGMSEGDVREIDGMLVKAVPFMECPKCALSPYGPACLYEDVCVGRRGTIRLMFIDVNKTVEDL